MGDYIRSYSISQFQKIHSLPEVNIWLLSSVIWELASRVILFSIFKLYRIEAKLAQLFQLIEFKDRNWCIKCQELILEKNKCQYSFFNVKYSVVLLAIWSISKIIENCYQQHFKAMCLSSTDRRITFFYYKFNFCSDIGIWCLMSQSTYYCDILLYICTW